MIVAPIVYEMLLYGSLALVAGSIIVFYKRDAPKVLPEAIARGSALRTLRRKIVRGAPWIGLIGGTIAAVWLYTQSTSFILVDDHGASWSIQLGGTPDFANIDARHDDTRADRVWVVNRSKHVVRVVDVQYGVTPFPSGFADTVPPGDAEAFDDIDYVGPDDKPPDSVRGTGSASRTWLTW